MEGSKKGEQVVRTSRALWKNKSGCEYWDWEKQTALQGGLLSYLLFGLQLTPSIKIE
jgi:hypothetical protein